MPRLKALALLSLATLFAPALAESANPARPGTVNYIEGQAALSGEALTRNSIGQAEVAPGQQITTTDGKVEVLLTPGVFLRLGQNSTMQMVSPDLTRTEVALTGGTAEIEVDQIYPQNNLLVDMGAAGTAQSRIEKTGLYEFDAANQTVRVLDGKATARDAAGKEVEIKSGHVLALNGDATKPAKFDRNKYTDSLTDWSDLRANYLGQANEGLAERYAGGAGFAPGWNWDPAFYGYTWLPGNGLFYSPFGYGFYSPLAYGSGFYGGGFYGGGFYRGGGIYRGGGLAGRGPGFGGVRGPGVASRGTAGSFNSGGGGMRTGGGSFGGGGFHGGGGFGGGHR